MLRIKSHLLFIVLSLVGSALYADSAVKIQAEHVFVPKGFDSNDEAEVVISGWLPSPCFRKPMAETKVAGSMVFVTLRSVKRESDLCVTMAYPYVVTATVGKLKEGSYRVVVNERSRFQKEADMMVTRATNDSIDDFTYAQVSDVLMSEDGKMAVLSGSNPSDCLALKELKTISNDKDTLAVLPIMEQVKADCKRVMTPFRYNLDLSNVSMHTDQLLLHIRSLEGSALNRVVSMQVR